MSAVSYTCREGDEGRKIYYILRNELKLSASLVKRLKNAKAVFLNGEPAYTTVTVKPGDIVSCELISAEREPDLVPEEGEVEVLFENEAMLILNKPAGMIVHPSRARQFGSLAALAAGYLLRTGQDARCHVVNRLDRDTSGCVVFAKNAHYKKLLSEAIAEKEAEKAYIALVCGAFPQEIGTVSEPIIRAEPMKMRRIVSPEGRRAVTHWKTLATDGEKSLVRFTLETGRTHQIRVHSSYMGCPLLGDELYSSEYSAALSERLGITSQALHAQSITLRDPISGEPVKAEAPLRRPELARVIELLEEGK